MNFWTTVAGMFAVTFGSRLIGLWLQTPLPPFWMRFLRFVPIAVFAALVAPNLAGDRSEWPIRLLAAAIAALIAWRSKQLWAAILSGMITFWIARLLFRP
jgi:branched-subunit amino acid transport protein